MFSADLELIRRVMAGPAGDDLSSVAQALCELWSWRNRDGVWQQSKCEELLLRLGKWGWIPALPEKPGWKRQRKRSVGPREGFLDETPLLGRLGEWAAPELEIVEKETAAAEQWRDLLLRHYLGERRVIGEHLKYLVRLEGRPVGAMLWGAAALRLGCRDRFLGWSLAERRAGLRRIANNYRLVIAPWVKIQGLGSHLLSRVAARIGPDWAERFGHGLDWLETFVDPARYRGVIYQAANWLCVGATRGHGRSGHQYHYHAGEKLVLLYPLARRARREAQRRARIDVAELIAGLATPFNGLPDQRTGPGNREGEEPMQIANAGPSVEQPTGKMTEADLAEWAKRLKDYHQEYADLFPRRELRAHALEYLQLLYSGAERKNVEQMTLFSQSTTPVRTMQHFVGQAKWDERPIIIRLQERVAQSLGEADGILILDGSDIPKKGKESVGVGRQHCGSLGKTENCQAGVFLAYASTRGATLIDARLYMPGSWFTPEQREARWESCRVPADLLFKTKPCIAADMVEEVWTRGQLPARWVLGDEAFGRDSGFLDRIGAHYWYFCEVPRDTRVGLRSTDPASSGETVLVEVQHLTPVQLPPFQRVIIRDGSKGPVEAEVARLRVAAVRKGVGAQEVWLFLSRNLATGKLKYFLSNAPADLPLEELVKVCNWRWDIEVCFEEGKKKLGLDHYELRSWPGWHHHMTLIMLAHLFLVRLGLADKKNSGTDLAPNGGPAGSLVCGPG